MIDLCSPHSSADEDATKGKWVRVDRDLNLQAGMWHLVRLNLFSAIVPRAHMHVLSLYIIVALAASTFRSLRISPCYLRTRLSQSRHRARTPGTE